MVKFPEAQARIYRNVFVCRRCKLKLRSPNMKILAGKVKCKKCGGRALRPVRLK
ncbi:50S ribosomal protein L40e [Candidatus Woesearchaeota archaeon]|nr:50S ribosomal protein L40e [Candidatus Woesearchaeota archaeon]